MRETRQLLIFDEVMTGFRVGLECAQGRYGIKPDLTTLGKVIGGGMPMAAFGGRRDIMQCLAPVGAVYQAGTLSGNPVAVAAGLATLKLVQAPGFYEKLAASTRQLTEGLAASAKKKWRAILRAAGGRHVRSLFSGKTTVQLCGGDELRSRSIQSLLSRPCFRRVSTLRPRRSRPGLFRRHTAMQKSPSTLTAAERIFGAWKDK